ncbi:ABC transporter ATP-binding protein [Clostridium sp. WB02_MRS01]|uniref:ABC transporter ATP-binding protein n=1 Tax=Clostridium sp. WB02_MRS01 TaxID=2605777 RepID=UPI0012B36336|nr:ABC transporter ATP-binding protein [Clostridium sp. WB02_MRS01]MSS11771.1 ABC transporter ATP-binding protein [Clostridium sp. WB02_MRS01]
MKRSFNSYRQIDAERLFIAYPNKKLICQLNAKNIKIESRVSGISSITFSVYKLANNEKNDGYDNIDIGKYIWSDQNGWFRISDIHKKDDGVNPYLVVTCYDLSIELTQTILTSFGSLGTEDDEQGGLDRYALYDTSDKSHSIAHIFMSKNPGWSFKFIDPEISKNRRSFDNDSVNSYGFLTGDVSKAFDCVFVFDGNERTVSAYKVENLGKGIPLALSFYNLLKQVDITWNEDDIKTVLHVSGGNDATGTALSIASVNPGGNDTISNFTYFYKDMSAELVAKLKEYYQKMEESNGLISAAMSELRILQDELAILNSHNPSVESSTNWTEYGLTQLKAKSAEYLTNMSVASDGNMSDPVIKQQYNKYSNLHTAVENEIVIRQNQIIKKEAEIKAKKIEANSYVVSIYDVLGDKLYKELQPFVREDTLCDDSFLSTDAMTDNEILEMKQALYDHGVEELNRVCFPQFNMTIDSVNFMVLFKYKDVVDHLELGDILYIKLDDDNVIKARLLKIEFNWDDFNDFKLTFSSKSNLEDGYFSLVEMQNMAQQSSTTLNYNKSGWNGASQQANAAYYATMKEFLDLSTQQIQSNATNQEVIIDKSGILLKKWLPDKNKYAPEKLWITNRQILMFEEPDGTNLKEPKIAIGKIYVTKNGATTSYYGIASEYLYGKLIFGESLTIQNKNNTFTIDEKGLVSQSTNGFRVQINPDDPSNILNISKSGTKLFYIDANTGKLVFKGRAEIDEGYIANWTISTNKLYSGGVGMSSDPSPGAIAYWAGNENANLAPFRVTNQGKLNASDVNITGGSLSIGNGFKVDSSGRLTAQSVNIKNGNINIGDVFEVSEDGVSFGDYYVSADGSNVLRSTDGTVVIQTAKGGPFGKYATINLSSQSGTTILSDHHLETPLVNARKINGDCILHGDNWWEGYTLFEALDYLYNKIS